MIWSKKEKEKKSKMGNVNNIWLVKANLIIPPPDPPDWVLFYLPAKIMYNNLSVPNKLQNSTHPLYYILAPAEGLGIVTLL